MARPATGPGEQILDAPLQYLIGRQADRLCTLRSLQGLIGGGQGKRRVRADDDRLTPRAGPINEGQEDSSQPSALSTLPGR